jgi:hypothetical protein
LVVGLFLGHGIFEELRGFVVEAMKFGTKATALEKAKNCFIGSFDGGLLAIWDWFSMYLVAIIVIKDKDVVVVTGGRHNEATGMV